MCYLHLYLEDTDLLRQISSKTSIWAFLTYQDPICMTCNPSAILYVSQRADPHPSAIILCSRRSESSQTTYCAPEPRDACGRLDGELAQHPPLLVYWCWVPSWKHPRFVCWLLMFADWVHHVCDTCNRCTAKSSLLFSSWIICWLALKIYLDTGDSITGKTSKDLPKYNCVYTCRTKWGWFLLSKFPLWALEPVSSLWHNQGDKGMAFPWPTCRSHIVLQPKKFPFSSPVLFVPSCPKKPAGNERAMPSCLPSHAGAEDPNPCVHS